MRPWQIGGLVAVGIIVIVLAVVPMFGGPTPGRLFDKTTDAECASDESGYQGARRQTARAAWVWSSDGYGWGCRYEYSDGTTEEVVFPRQ